MIPFATYHLPLELSKHGCCAGDVLCSWRFVNAITPNDMYDGLTGASDLFVTNTIARFEAVKELHIILLVLSIALIICFCMFLFRPYTARLHSESKTIAGTWHVC